MTPTILLMFLLLSAIYVVCECTVSMRITSRSVFIFTFTEGQANLSASQATDLSGANLMLPLVLTNSSTSWSPLRQGLTLTGQSTNGSIGVQSSDTVRAIVSQLVLPPTSFTVEAWLSLTDYQQSGMIVGFGSWDPQTTSSSCIGSASGSSGQRDWQLAQRNGNVTFILSNFGNTPACSSTTIQLNQSSPYHHIVARVSVNSGAATVIMYYNAVSASTSLISPQSSPSNWIRSNTLQISSERLVGPTNITWRGVLYLLAMYKYALSQSDVTTNFQSGLPNSAPVLNRLFQTVNVTQDTTMNMLPLDLGATDFDGDTLLLQLWDLPSSGIVYYVDSSNMSLEITSAMLPWYTDLPVLGSFAFTPAPSTWGTKYGKIQFRAFDGNAFSYSSSVNINIDKIIVPPVPANTSFWQYAGSLTLVNLTGSDIDPSSPVNSPVTNVFLLSLPTQGWLYQYKGLNSPGSIINSTFGMNITGPNAAVFYRSYGFIGAGAVGYTDSFSFGVVAKNTRSVTAGVVTISVRNSLTTSPLNLTLSSDVPRQFALMGSSASSSRFYHLLLSLPSQGQLTSNGVSVVPFSGTGSPGLQSSATKLNSSSLVFTSNVSIYDGRYDMSLDPAPVSFWYTVVDEGGNSAAPSLVTINYIPIHHAHSMSTPLTVVYVNRTAFNTNSAYWTVVPSRVIDSDAITGSAFSTVAVSFPPLYTITATLSPTAGALIRLAPDRTVVVQVLSGDNTGSPQIVFTCAYEACNVALSMSMLQFQASVVGWFNLSISSTQMDTSISSSVSVAFYANSTQTNTGTGGGGANGSDQSGSGAFFGSQWFWIVVGVGGGVVVAGGYYLKWRRRKRESKTRTTEMTAVAVELAKAVGGSGKSKESTEAEIDAKAHAKAAEMAAHQWDMIGHALASPRLSIGVNEECFVQAPSTMMHLPFYGQPSMPTTPRFGGSLLSPRPCAGRSSSHYGFASPAAVAYELPGVQHDDIQLAITEQQTQLEQQQQQLTALRMIASSPRSQSCTPQTMRSQGFTPRSR